MEQRDGREAGVLDSDQLWHRFLTCSWACFCLTFPLSNEKYNIHSLNETLKGQALWQDNPLFIHKTPQAACTELFLHAGKPWALLVTMNTMSSRSEKKLVALREDFPKEAKERCCFVSFSKS